MQLTGIFDSHAHYDHEDFDSDRSELLSSMAEKGISHILNSSSDIISSRASVKLTAEYPFFYASVGVHPHDATTLNDEVIGELKKLSEIEKVVAIGEIGLDFHYDFSPRDIQREAFEKQLILAKELDMPIIIHSREACEETLNLVKKYRPKGVVHCFSGSVETALEYVKLGMYIGLTGVVTFKNAKKPIEVAAAVPIEHLLIETDCPYMAPVPFRGKRCDSSMLISVANTIANTKGIPPQELCDITRENVFRAFEINK